MRYASDLLQTPYGIWRTLLNSHLFQKNKAKSPVGHETGAKLHPRPSKLQFCQIRAASQATNYQSPALKSLLNIHTSRSTEKLDSVAQQSYDSLRPLY